MAYLFVDFNDHHYVKQDDIGAQEVQHISSTDNCLGFVELESWKKVVFTTLMINTL